MTMLLRHISLASHNDVCKPIDVGIANKATIHIDTQSDTYSGTDWEVTIEWNLHPLQESGDEPEADWQSYGYTLDADTPARRNISVSGSGSIRLRVTTADGAANPEARVYINLQ